MKTPACDRLALDLLGAPYDSLTPLQQAVIDAIAREAPSKAQPASVAQDQAAGYWDRLADAVARVGGSWGFIFGFGAVLVVWITINSPLLRRAGIVFDPYPFIFLNLILSMLAAIQAPVIMMSQNRSAAKDRAAAEHDYVVNLRAELEILRLHTRLDQIEATQLAAVLAQQAEILALLRTGRHPSASGALGPGVADPYEGAMLTGLSVLARDARAWPFEQARSLLARVLKRLPGEERAEAEALFAQGDAETAVARFPALIARPVVLQTGYGASGLPHIGTFQETARTTMVRSAFRALTEDAIPTVLIVFSDDMDGLRKAPPGLPNQEALHEDLHKPLTSVRDPFGDHASFGAHNNARMRRFLDAFGFDYQFRSSTEAYRDGSFDAALRTALERFDAIQAVMLPTLGPERRATYSPFLPISPTTGRVLQVPTLERDVQAGTIVFEDEDGTRVASPVTGGRVKMQWKPDWAMRWAALQVDYEMSGKDLIDSVKASAKICRVLGGDPPESFTYELFLDENGEKISKSRGNGLTMEEWMRYSTPESLAYYVFQNPRAAKRLSFDVIPKATDEYLQQLDAYAGQTPAERLNNPVWSVHSGAPPERGSPVSFALLLNLVGVANAADKGTLWGFLERYCPGATAQSEPLLDQLAGYALNYYEDFVAPKKRFRAAEPREASAMRDLVLRLQGLGPDCRDGEAIQNEVYAAGKEAGFEPLRAWFGALYEVLLGQETGPRFGSFAAIYGVERTIGLIERALDGALVSEGLTKA